MQVLQRKKSKYFLAIGMCLIYSDAWYLIRIKIHTLTFIEYKVEAL